MNKEELKVKQLIYVKKLFSHPAPKNDADKLILKKKSSFLLAKGEATEIVIKELKPDMKNRNPNIHIRSYGK